MNAHDTFNDSESIHLNNSKDKGKVFNPTSKKVNTANIVVTTTDAHVNNWAPENPDFLPKNQKLSILIVVR